MLTTPSFVVDLALKIEFDLATSVEEEPIVPERFVLQQNYPNPFNPSTTISFTIPITTEVTLKIFDVRGHEVETLINIVLSPGDYKVQWNVSGHSNGVYFYRLREGSFAETRKLLLLK